MKNLPQGFTEEELKKLFEPYGNIKSLALRCNQIGTFGFVCFDDPRGINKHYGPECAQKAIDSLNGFDVSSVSASETSDASDIISKLVVRHALKSSERMIEKLREAMSYKASKRRCNLYVKGFPVDWTKEELLELFGQHGVIENVRFEAGNTNAAGQPSPFAFVCYKDPLEAAKAKTSLHGHQVREGTRGFTVNYYEIKEERIIQNEEAKDKADWERYTAQQKGSGTFRSLASQPKLASMVGELISLIKSTELDNA